MRPISSMARGWAYMLAVVALTTNAVIAVVEAGRRRAVHSSEPIDELELATA